MNVRLFSNQCSHVFLNGMKLEQCLVDVDQTLNISINRFIATFNFIHHQRNIFFIFFYQNIFVNHLFAQYMQSYINNTILSNAIEWLSWWKEHYWIMKRWFIFRHAFKYSLYLVNDCDSSTNYIIQGVHYTSVPNWHYIAIHLIWIRFTNEFHLIDNFCRKKVIMRVHSYTIQVIGIELLNNCLFDVWEFSCCHTCLFDHSIV